MVSNVRGCSGSFKGDFCYLKWDSCHPESKPCERKQLHNEPLTIGNPVNLVTRTAGVPVVYFIVLCGYCITSLLSVIASLSMQEKSCTTLHYCLYSETEQLL